MSTASLDSLPLSAAQYGIWLGQKLDPQNPSYCAAECVEFAGGLELAAFERALRQSLEEAEALSVCIAERDGVPVQRIVRPLPFELEQVELSDQDGWLEARAWMMRDQTRPMELERGPLVRHALLRTREGRVYWYRAAHHAVLDGFGFSLFTQRVAELYSALVTQRPAPPRSFGTLMSVLEEDRAYQSSAEREFDRAFWLRMMEGAGQPVSLSERLAFPSTSALRDSRELPRSLKDALTALGRVCGGSWADALLAAFAAYLGEESGASEVILGLPVMARVGAALRVPCMAMNIVPLRLDLSRGSEPLALVPQVVQRLREMRPHLRYRYEHLRRDLGLVGGKRRLFGPVVNILPFDYGARFAGERPIIHNLSAGPVEDLALGVLARADAGPRLAIDANPSCYDQDRLQTIQRSLELFVAQYVRGEPARKRHASSWLRGEALREPARDVIERIFAHAEQRPHAIALVAGHEAVTYAELIRDARALASHLLAKGALADQPVAVLLPRGRAAVTAMLACLFAGAAYLPLDPDGPRLRTVGILEDARPKLVVTSAPFLARRDGWPAHACVLVEDAGDADLLGRPVSAAPRDLAYVLYTSGSTGVPNGVLVERQALSHFVAAAEQCYGLTSTDRVLQFAPLHFDASVEEIFLTLALGATLVVRSDEMMESMARFLEATEQLQISVLDLPTAFWHELAYALSEGRHSLPNRVHTVIVGGDAVLSERLRRWRNTVGDRCRLLNTYGPTESTVVATCADLTRCDDEQMGVPIGLPLPGVGAAVIVESGRLAAPGAEGELYLLGPSLARGYLGRRELTAERFVSLSALPGRPRAYRTGDRVTQGADGRLRFLGRVDDELKLSGQRVDLREVESVLSSFPGVREVAVVVRRGQLGEKYLVAHVVFADGTFSLPNLREHARERLLAAALPARFSVHEELPKTASGKLDRKALGILASDAQPANHNGPPLNELAREVLAIFRAVLGAANLGPDDDFFERGGQSLQTIQVAHRVGLLLGREVRVGTVFDHPTASGLARALEPVSHVDEDGPASPSALIAADAHLPDDVVPGPIGRAGGEPRQVLLTGATGFVGGHLLRVLLERSEARVVCLVRAASDLAARERVMERLREVGGVPEQFEERVSAYAARLDAADLGLSPGRHRELVTGCDTVLHSAASVSLMRGYQSERAANVSATRELLRFACSGRRKAFHHLSTLAVGVGAGERGRVPERFVEFHRGLRDGYTQSKWVAERLAHEARARGLPVTVYRLGRVTGPTRAASVNANDIVWRLLRAGVAVGGLPALPVSEPWTPVDFVAEAIVSITFSERFEGLYNLATEQPISLDVVFAWLRQYGYPLESLSMAGFLKRLRLSKQPDLLATGSFFEARADAPAAAGMEGGLQVDSERARDALRVVGLSCPTISRALVFRYFDAAVRSGLFPRPAEGPSRSPE